MAVQNSDLLVIQTTPAEGETSKLYKLSVGDLDSYFTADGDGTVRSIQTNLPLSDDGDTVNPTISIREATVEVDGVVHRLASAADVITTNNAASTRAVVTANLLHATNEAVANLSVEIDGEISSIQTDLNALTIRVDDLETDLSNLTIKVGDVEVDLGNLTLVVEGNTAEITSIKTDITNIQQELEDLEEQIGDFQGDIDGGIYAPID